MEQYTVTYREWTISFVLIRKRVKNINLRVKPDSTVVVSANRTVSPEQIKGFVKKKASWILKNISRFAEKNKNRKILHYGEGETIYHLGIPRQLVLSPAEDKEEISLDGRFIRFSIWDQSDFVSKKRLYDRWLKKQGEAVFNEAVDRMLSKLACCQIERPSVTIRTMKSRWGSCSFTRQKITLNTELLKFSLDCIDYVVLHELVHFIHHRHDEAFYNFLSEVMPRWQEQQRLLRTAGIEKNLKFFSF
ncbi:MAG: SprT family zinc-dependent metalloprotease [Bacillota bacterium]|nr:SprT family zinc-dependent metalloprotease [Bacillota bacterium]